MKIPAIHFFSENIKYRLPAKRENAEWLIQVIEKEGNRPGEINIILCDDEYLHKLNLEYLQHDTLTDIITFDYSEEGEAINGDIYISKERALENSKIYGQSLEMELRRLLVHGVLHLLGYKDKTKKEKALMTSKEDYYLSLHP